MRINSILQKQFALLEKNSTGNLGVCAIHIESQKSIQFNAEIFFLMCSTFKLPIAMCLLQAVEQGQLQLQDLHEVKKSDICPGVNSTLNQLNFDLSNAKISLHNLLLMMLQESDNTSTDILLRLVGGPQAVTSFLKKANINDVRIDRYFYDFLCAWDGVKHSPDQRPSLAEYQVLEDKVDKKELKNIRDHFLTDKQDTTTPLAMTQLLIKLFNNEILSPAHSQFLLNIMRGCKRGNLRLMGLLPQGTPIAHKTGTVTGHVSNIGIITLPHERGHIAVSAYIKNANKEQIASERILAEVGRTVYDYFLFSDELFKT